MRAGYPPLIVRRKDRERYYEALSLADDGNLEAMLDLMWSRAKDAFRDLERTASQVQKYNPVLPALKKKQEGQLAIWNKATELLLANVKAEVTSLVDQCGGDGGVRDYDAALDSSEYLMLCEGQSVSGAWAFSVEIHPPGCSAVSRLAWIGFRSDPVTAALGGKRGPTMFWSAPNTSGTFPRWRRALASEAPGGEEMTYEGDSWVVRVGAKCERLGVSQLAQQIVQDLVKMA